LKEGAGCLGLAIKGCPRPLVEQTLWTASRREIARKRSSSPVTKKDIPLEREGGPPPSTVPKTQTGKGGEFARGEVLERHEKKRFAVLCGKKELHSKLEKRKGRQRASKATRTCPLFQGRSSQRWLVDEKGGVFTLTSSGKKKYSSWSLASPTSQEAVP